LYSPADWVAEAARRFPDRAALRIEGRSLTFAELDHKIAKLTERFRAGGVRPGMRLAILEHNSSAAAMPHVALRLGATLLPLNHRLSAAEIDWQLRHARPDLLMADAKLDTLVPQRMEIGLDRLHARSAGSPMDSVPAPTSDTPLAIIYTSGTTGKPKGAILTAGNFAASAAASAAVLGVRDDDRWLLVLPWFHVGGLSILFRSAMQGTCVVVHDRFDAHTVNRAIDSEGITIVSLVAVMLERLLDDRQDRPLPKSFRCALVGGGPVPRDLLERCHRIGMPAAITYGLTEATSQVATMLPGEAVKHLGAAGRALPGTEIRIDGSTEGEILVRGPTVMAGYLDDPDATAHALRDGWLHTGDVGRLDDDGYLHVLDRRDDLIVTGGENVYPAEVEAVLASHPAIDEAGVIGEHDEQWGQRVVAVVRLHDDAAPIDAATIIAHCRERLAGYKVPRVIHFTMSPLPRTASGKLQRSRLRDLQ
jgi:O-succinylbenzoic acid--CoA ligase